MPAPPPPPAANFVKAKLIIDGGIDARLLLQPDRVLARQGQRVEVRARSPARASPSRSSRGGQPRQMELSLLFDQTFPPYKMTVRAATAALLDAMEVPSRPERRHADRGPAVRHLPVGRADLQGRDDEPDVRVQALPPDGEPIRADVKLTLKQAAATIKGQNPTTRAQAGFGMHTVRDGDTLPSISYGAYGDATQLAADRRGQRRRQPAAPAPRQLAVAADAGELMPAAATQSSTSPASTSSSTAPRSIRSGAT